MKLTWTRTQSGVVLAHGTCNLRASSAFLKSLAVSMSSCAPCPTGDSGFRMPSVFIAMPWAIQESEQMAAAQVWDKYCFHNHYVQELEKGNAAITDHFVSYFRPRLRSF